MPEEFGKWTTAYRRYELWVKRGLCARILGALGEDGLTEPVTKESLTDVVGPFWALGRGMQRGLRQAPPSYMLQLAIVNG